MHDLPTWSDPNLLVGADQFSDAGVYRVADDLAIVQTVDFFPPAVDDPFTYGQIAAANSLSDVYAMGGRPITALNIVGFPDDKLPLDILQQILKGGADRVLQAGAVIVGGHSVRDAEIKYGLSVTGTVHPDRIMTNAGAKPGDVLVLTKGLGTGFVTTADRANRCPDDALQAAIDSMITLNASAALAAAECGAHAATDITGFALAGHGAEMAQASDVALEIEVGKLPLLHGALALAKAGHYSRANETNRSFTKPITRIEGQFDETLAEFLFDPQTSGGLLIALPPDNVDALLDRCIAAGLSAACIVGRVLARQDKHLIFKP